MIGRGVTEKSLCVGRVAEPNITDPYFAPDELLRQQLDEQPQLSASS